MRRFNDGDTITIEPWRSAGFPIIRDLMVDRSAYDKIIQAGGFVSVNTGGVPDANAIAIPKEDADLAMDAAACIGCGACAAACKNGSAMLFVSAKVSQLALLPQGRVELPAGQRQWLLRWMSSVLEIVPIPELVKPNVLKISLFRTLHV